MPKKQKNVYSVEGHKFDSFAAATRYAVDLSLQRAETVSIKEKDPKGTYVGYIHVQAEGEVERE